MRTIIIDDNKQAVKDLNERLARFSEVEVVVLKSLFWKEAELSVGVAPA